CQQLATTATQILHALGTRAQALIPEKHACSSLTLKCNYRAKHISEVTNQKHLLRHGVYLSRQEWHMIGNELLNEVLCLRLPLHLCNLRVEALDLLDSEFGYLLNTRL